MVMRSRATEGRVRPDASKNGQISPLGRRSGCQDYGRRPRRQAVLSKRGNSAKIHPGLGFIWGIPVNVILLTTKTARS